MVKDQRRQEFHKIFVCVNVYVCVLLYVWIWKFITFHSVCNGILQVSLYFSSNTNWESEISFLCIQYSILHLCNNNTLWPSHDKPVNACLQNVFSAKNMFRSDAIQHSRKFYSRNSLCMWILLIVWPRVVYVTGNSTNNAMQWAHTHTHTFYRVEMFWPLSTHIRTSHFTNHLNGSRL